MLTVACVRTGTKYSVEYVHRLRAMVARHLDRPHRFVVLTDRPDELPGYEIMPTVYPAWWAKIELFRTDWLGRLLYFDLDTVITGDLAPLADLDCEFGICENFTRLSGNLAFPCRFGSCVMSISPGWGWHVWDGFHRHHRAVMELNRYGDQQFIEQMTSDTATLLQGALPPGFFVGYRDLPKHAAPPQGCSVVVFAGTNKPHNTNCEWARAAWAA